MPNDENEMVTVSSETTTTTTDRRLDVRFRIHVDNRPRDITITIMQRATKNDNPGSTDHETPTLTLSHLAGEALDKEDSRRVALAITEAWRQWDRTFER